MNRVVRIAVSQVPETGTSVVTIDDRRILLCRSANGIHAMDETCPHQVMSLNGARIRGTSIFCPHHGARFSLEDGRSLSPMTTCGLTLYQTEVDGDTLIIHL
jgi:3-phenylpropionate/trans-cinnamate dioxygenase ferredoxin component